VRRIAGGLAAALLLTGCANEEPSEQDPAPAATIPAAAASGECLVLVWQQQDAPNEEFDRANDMAEGGAISCATGTSASQFEAALAAIREAAGSGDKARLLEQLGIPLLYIDAQGIRREIEEPQRVEAVFDEVFTPETIGLLERVRLEDLTVVAGEGAFVELGSIWLVVDQPGGRPRIATVNQQALGEAAAAARRAASQGETRPAPMNS
jgi:hypothetical protein